MPAAAPALVKGAGVPVVGSPQPAGERIGALGDRHQMNMIGHQTVAEHSNADLLGMLGQQPTVRSAVVIVEEGCLAVVAPLREVMRLAHRHHPS